MPHSTFVKKFIQRLGLIDPKRVESYLESLAEEIALFEEIFDSMLDGVIVLDANKKILLANHASCKLLGVPHMNVGHDIQSYIPDQPIVDMIEEVISSGTNIYGVELVRTLPIRRILTMNLSPIMDKNKKMTGILLIISDVTEKRYFQRRSAHNEKMDSLQILAAGVAHELGNPLNSIGIHLQLIDREITQMPSRKQKVVKQHLTIVKEELSRLDKIIKSFLAAVRPAPITFTEEDINAILHDVIQLLSPELQERDIHLNKKLDVKLPMSLMDKNEISQALLNVIKNAMEAIHKRGQIDIRTSIRDEKIVVQITDNGPGIAKDQVACIFEPYFTTKNMGTGLGLMIVQRILNQHGGFVEVESKVGQGTTFRFILPVARKERRFLITEGERDER